MKKETELEARIRKRAAKKAEKRLMRSMSFAAIFASLIISVFFVYDIAVGIVDANAAEASSYEPTQPASDEPVYTAPETVRYPIEDFVVGEGKDFLVHLYADGKYYSCVYSAEDNKTVLDLLYRFSIFLGEDDEINYSVNTPLEEDMLVKVGRVTYEYLTFTEVIPYEVETIDVLYTVFAKDIKIGVPTEGEDGIRKITKRETYVDGVLVETVTISQKITKKPVSGKVYRDCTYLLDRGHGAPSGYVKKLEDFTFTAYTYVEKGGLVTYTGDKTRVGYVAVDPSVIPLYSKLYIVLENGFVYGYCYAMDTGGAIKGNRIDLFLPTLSDCNQLGKRKGTVYIITEGKGG